PAEYAAESAARRMFAPVTSSSLTTIAAFLPMMMVGGVMGKIMFEIPLVIVCIVLASLFECFLILPAHMKHALIHSHNKVPGHFRKKMDASFQSFQEKIFLPLIQKAIRFRSVTLALAIGLFILAIGLVAGGRIAYTFFPGAESQVIYTNVSFTAGTPSERVKRFLDNLTQSLEITNQHFGGNIVLTAVVRQGQSSSGAGTGQRSGNQYGSLFVELISPDQRDFRNSDFIAYWKSLVRLPAGVELFNMTQRKGGPPGQDIDIRLSGNSPAQLKKAAEALQQKLRTYPGVSAIEDDLPWGQEQLIYELTPVAKTLGLNMTSVGQQLRAAFDGLLVQVFQIGNDEIEVILRLPKSERDKISDLNSFSIHLPNGAYAPLQSVVSLQSRKGFDALRHSQTLLTVSVTGDVDRTLNNSNRILNELAEDYLPGLAQRYALQYEYEGQASRQKETMADMKTGGVVALALIYIILAWVFSSYVKPLVVMIAIPFGITGAFLGHYILDIELTILSLFGIFGLSGIVVNDSIILITVYQELRENGIEVSDAIVQAANNRLRAVILTSLTTIAGLTPLLFESSVQAQFLIPMAVSITFGLAFATLLVLLVIPAVLSYQETVNQFFQRNQT
ncbi:MAG TPA: efflux RND transporter permease subunit, partial [Gammaproteobacteria bacterium]|nr:efflux RND transporter permease subunit [Gammaproteobacteria bacterium]